MQVNNSSIPIVEHPDIQQYGNKYSFWDYCLAATGVCIIGGWVVFGALSILIELILSARLPID